jgi:hypothetical protein
MGKPVVHRFFAGGVLWHLIISFLWYSYLGLKSLAKLLVHIAKAS